VNALSIGINGQLKASMAPAHGHSALDIAFDAINGGHETNELLCVAAHKSRCLNDFAGLRTMA
jgi:hypothetical protein